MSHKVEVLVEARTLVGEGPIWDGEKQILYWVDILSNLLFVYDPASGENRGYDLGQHVGTVVPRASGGVMVALRDGFASFDLESETLTMISDPEAGNPGNRFNDGKCDPAGRLWAGTMAYDSPTDQGSLYRLDADMSVHHIFGGVGISNGIIWSLDASTMYYIDSMRYNVRAYDYDNATGDIVNERVIIAPDKSMGLPDGMTIDAEGMLWVAYYGGSCIRRWNPDTAEQLDQIDLPTSSITACAFGGPNLETLFITCACQQMDEAAWAREPLAGALFAAKPGVRGVSAHKFAG